MAQRLLALANDPMEVRTAHDDRLAFVVPDDLYERYLNGDTKAAEPEPEITEEMVRRRPGRPRKVMPAKESDD